jgi:hypothetical protein
MLPLDFVEEEGEPRAAAARLVVDQHARDDNLAPASAEARASTTLLIPDS